MSSRDLLQELAEGRAVKIVIEGDGASMRGVVRHGCVLTLTPVRDFREVQAGEIVLTRWRGGNHLPKGTNIEQGEVLAMKNRKAT